MALRKKAGRTNTAILGFMLGLIPAQALANSGAIQPQYTRTVWKVQDGLPEDTVQGLAETSDGYLWIGTTGGLARFDGARFVLYGLSAPHTLGVNSVFCLEASRDGGLWIGTEGGGLLHLLNGQVQSYGAAEGLTDGFVRSVHEDRSGIVWVGTDSGLFQVKGSRVQRVEMPAGMGPLAVHVISEDRQSRIWVGGSRLLSITQGKQLFYGLPGRYSSNRVKTVLETKDGTVWVGTVSGLERSSGQKFERVPEISGTVRTLRQTSDGTLWIGTIGNGLWTYKDGFFSRLKSLLPGNTVLKIFEDDSRQVWLGLQDGLVRLSRTPVREVRLPGGSDADFDNAGASVPGARITVVNTGTNATQAGESNSEGIYSIGQLAPGTYTVTVERAGFRKAVETGIVLTVNQSATLNVPLQIGDVEQSISVSADAALINATTAEISTVVDQHAISQLPLNGRDPSSLVFLAPGVTNVLNTGGGYLQTGFSFPTETGASANGGRQGSTYYLLDGVQNMDTYLLLAAPFPNSDAVQEFRVISNNFDAHYGFSPGAVVSIQTKSGSNQWHGGAFEFIRNSDLNAGNYFSHAVDSLRRNQFGAYVGGPIIKNKLFFFANYQGTRSSSQGATNPTYTPTAAMLNGDFSAVPIKLQGPFVNNMVNPALFSPAAVTIAKTALPLGGDPASGLTNYASGGMKNSLDEGTFRLDWELTSKQHIVFRTYINNFDQPASSVNGNILSVLQETPYNAIQSNPIKYYNQILSHTWTINPSLVNVVSGFWTQESAHSSAQVFDQSGQPVCLSRYIKVNELPGQCYIEGLSVNNGFSTAYIEPSQEIRTSFGVSDAVTKTIGNHALSFGVDLWHQYAKELTQYPTQPIINFNGSYTGFGLADFLLGKAAQFTQGAGEIADVSGIVLGLFAQDQYRIRPTVTLTAGVRWDPNLPPTSAGGRGAAFVPGQQSQKFPGAPLGLNFPGDKGVNSALMPTSYGYIEPRIGGGVATALSPEHLVPRRLWNVYRTIAVFGLQPFCGHRAVQPHTRFRRDVDELHIVRRSIQLPWDHKSVSTLRQHRICTSFEHKLWN